MGSVPNCQKEIADHYPIRWFKCKLKPPKKKKKEKFWNITPETENIYIHMSKLVPDPSDTDKSCNSSNSRKHRVLLT